MNNKKTLLLLVAMAIFVAVAMVGVTSAVVCTAETCGGTTLIAGKIYNSNFTDVISGANVNVTCNGTSMLAVSAGDGTYSANFDPSTCGDGSAVTVDAEKDGMTGTNTGTVSGLLLEGFNCTLNFAVVNVPLIPEFGLTVGLVTVLGAVAVFFLVRRR